MIEIGVGLVAGLLIILALKFFIELPFKIIWNSIIGAAILYLVNLTGILTIKITFIHALIVGVFGVPGLILLAIYLNFIK
ncbi:MAG: pro-sigmaK processing inhibitor BofA family protein [Selenomonadaceae bacterium]|nr:pro-sigmaK processing inhibitor BofA family protein [Selenomonadaceae bacterium]MBQ6758363.1 pro-sigmaK processing inhibitor BofA family protein [Selenomonadaceae bacterium]MBR0103288.1 pro-sigmaK processing inhibitor BofA family protein [Selenomonadaceae bacterium]MBR3051849.1 pro-sigmaK processing inhibitor BofA family protein [Selenomonadaceae bacterium]MBR6712817.1 pro-sigmaK processing inhibitor BofA family protein [Selenomonadaceae bacterium]